MHSLELIGQKPFAGEVPEEFHRILAAQHESQTAYQIQGALKTHSNWKNSTALTRFKPKDLPKSQYARKREECQRKRQEHPATVNLYQLESGVYDSKIISSQREQT